MSEKQSLPPEEKEKVVDISLRHIVLAFSSLVVASFSVGVGIVLIKDSTKLRRQKAIIDAATELLLILQNKERSGTWNVKKTQTDTPSTSVTTK